MSFKQPPFSVDVTRRSDIVSLAIAGELDLGTLRELEAALPSLDPGETLVVDLRELDFIDSSGIHLLMRLDVAARKERWSIVLVRAQPDVQRVLDLCHVGDRIAIIESPADVRAAPKGPV